MAIVVLTQTGIYALRAMAVLAQLPRGEALRARELAAATGVPVHYLAKVLRRLVVSGLVESRRGHRGGFRLPDHHEPPTFATVLTAVDAMPAGDGCVFGQERCEDATPCALHESWMALRTGVLQWAHTTRVPARE